MEGLREWSEVLDQLLKDVDQEWLQALKEEYRAKAERQLVQFQKFLLTPWSDIPKDHRGALKTPMIPESFGFYVKISDTLKKMGWSYELKYSRDGSDPRILARREVDPEASRIELVIKNIMPPQPQYFDADYSRAEEDAFNWWRGAREQYIFKNAQKLSQAAEGLQVKDIQKNISLCRSGCIEGNLFISFEGGKSLRTQTTIKWNQSCLGTVFPQYPTLFWVLEGGEQVRQSLEWLMGNFAQKDPASSRTLPEKVVDLKAMSKLAFLLVNREALEEGARKRKAKGYRMDTRGPEGEIKKLSNKLKLPLDITPEEAKKILYKSIPEDAKGELLRLSRGTVKDCGVEFPGAEKPPAGKAGKEARDLQKALMAMDMISVRDVAKVLKWGMAVAEGMSSDR